MRLTNTVWLFLPVGPAGIEDLLDPSPVAPVSSPRTKPRPSVTMGAGLFVFTGGPHGWSEKNVFGHNVPRRGDPTGRNARGARQQPREIDGRRAQGFDGDLARVQKSCRGSTATFLT